MMTPARRKSFSTAEGIYTIIWQVCACLQTIHALSMVQLECLTTLNLTSTKCKFLHYFAMAKYLDTTFMVYSTAITDVQVWCAETSQEFNFCWARFIPGSIQVTPGWDMLVQAHTLQSQITPQKSYSISTVPSLLQYLCWRRWPLPAIPSNVLAHLHPLLVAKCAQPVHHCGSCLNLGFQWTSEGVSNEYFVHGTCR